ncbi:hypothetical protein COMA1_10630 [Candidatus Nitrospira nitrosa]|uniref:Uncharacterized protein n=1 Tax=Candidatus Nitrospira nitrosa TaxID=1742972 RepID=A0A0S4L783_9BACT|nr:hypothetical protein COMA1_10630 [Candidatus Nitrospira nitrosa]
MNVAHGLVSIDCSARMIQNTKRDLLLENCRYINLGIKLTQPGTTNLDGSKSESIRKKRMGENALRRPVATAGRQLPRKCS